MAAYIPPKKGLDPTPQLGAAAPSSRTDGPDAASAAGLDVLQRNSAVIGAWLSAQRQNVACSVTNFHRAQLDHPEFQASYLNIAGREITNVTPKPTPSPVSLPQDDEEDTQPNELVKLAAQEQVLPQTPLYLLVLFGMDKVAAIPMTALADCQPDYSGVADKSQWTQNPHTQLLTMQAKLEGGEFVMLPLDLTGQDAAVVHYLSTAALGDRVASCADPRSIPLLNGNKDAVFTAGGVFTFGDDQPLQLAATMPGDGSQYFAPHAITSDGIYYYFPQVNASCSVKIDPTSCAGFSGSPALTYEVEQAEQAESDSIQKVDTYTAIDLQDYSSVTDTKGPLGATHDVQMQTIQTTSHVMARGPVSVGGTVVGTSYRFIGNAVAPPTIDGFKASVSGIVTESYSSGGNTILTTPPGNTDLSLAVPVMGYTTSGGALSVDTVGVSATQVQEDTGQFDTTATPSALQPTGLSQSFQYTTTSGSSSDPSFVYSEHSRMVTSYGQPRPDGPYTDDIVDKYVQDVIARVMGYGDVGAPQTITSQTITVTEEFAAPPQIDAPYSELPPGQPANNYNSVTVGFSSNGGAVSIESGYACLNLPLFYPMNGSRKISCDVSAFGETLHYDNDGGGEISNITMHVLPLALDGQHFYTRNDTEKNTFKVVTPYGSYLSTNTTAFTPWLHVSNGDHVIQGYAVDGALHAFLDGSSDDWLARLATALDCQPADVVTMIMDVTLAKVKAIARVKPSNYATGATTTSTSGD